MAHLLQTAALIGAGLLLAAASGAGADAEQASAPLLVVRAGQGGSVAANERPGGMVMLRAVPQRGHFFSAWRCIEGLACPEGTDGRRMAVIQFAPEGAAGLAAEFEAEPAQATLTILGAAGGTVASECGAVCTRRGGSEVLVQAVPDQGHRFSSWECQGGAACQGIDLTDPGPRLTLSGSITLTPIYAATAGGDAAVRSAQGGSWRLAAECDSACAAGEGWTATASAAPDSSHVFRSWGCAEGAACPQEVLQASGAELRLGFNGRLALAPSFSEFRLFSPDLINFAGTSRRVEQQAICNIQDECLYTLSNGSTRLSVATLEADERTYEWSLMPDNPHLSLGNQRGSSIDLIADGALGEIVTVVVEVASPQTEFAVSARDTLMVVVVPAALAVNVDDSCSGFVASHRGEYFVVTAAHCLTEFNFELDAREVQEEFDLEIGPVSDSVRLKGQTVGLDHLTDVGVLRIPDPGLEWIPRIHPTAPVPGRPLRVVGYPRTADFLGGDEMPQLSVTAGMSVAYDQQCEHRFPFPSPLAVGGLPAVCDAQVILVAPDASSPRGSGGAVLNADGRVVAIVSGGILVGDQDPMTLVAVIGNQLERLFRGGRRCLQEYVTEEKTIQGHTYTDLVATVFNDCSVEEPSEGG